MATNPYYPKNFNMIVASMINWMANNQNIVTNFNRGAVIRTMLESVALELEEVHFRVFDALGIAIAEAVYDAFSFPRLPSVQATGLVRFSRSTPAPSDILIPVGVVVQTAGDAQNQSKQYSIIEAAVLYGNASFGVDAFDNNVGGNFIILQSAYGDKSGRFKVGEAFTITGSALNDGSFTVYGASYNGGTGKTSVRVNEVVVDEPVTTATMTIPGRTEADAVPVQSNLYGSAGNTAPGTISQFSTPILGIERVTNPAAIGGGIDAEADSNRRARFNLFIQSLARGTLGALEFAALQVPAIATARAVDSQPVYVVAYPHGFSMVLDNGADHSVEANAPFETEFDLLENSGTPNAPAGCAIGAEVQFGDNSDGNFGVYIELSEPGVQDIAATGPSGYWFFIDAIGLPQPCTTGFIDETNGLTKSGSLLVNPSDPGFAAWSNPTFPGGNVGLAKGKRLFVLLFAETSVVGDQFQNIPKAIQIFTNPLPGVVHVFVSESGGILDDAVKKQAEDMINGFIDPGTLSRVMGYRAAGIRVKVLGPVQRLIDITAVVRAASNFDPADVQKLVEAGLGGYTTSFVLGQSLYVSELIQFIMNLHDEAIQDVQITWLDGQPYPAPDVVASPNQLLILYNITVTVS